MRQSESCHLVTLMVTNKPAGLSEETIERALREFGIRVDSEQVLKIQQYMKLLLLWNEKINLTAIRDPLEILYRHFCECMYAVVGVPIKSGRLADVGSGAGFPGLPLKIICPEVHVTLVESNVKKGTFLAEVIRELGLSDVRVLISRYEELGEEIAPLDSVCSRAFGEFGPFLQWAGSSQVSANQVVLWIGGRDMDEVRSYPGWEWREPVAVPQSLRRFLLIGRKKTTDLSA
jgi:16S rRNA (guanine527-N7)-methyltransferase